MNAQQLKNAILQEAIEGRLVSQDPNDEPASVLLARIRKEKVKLVKEGKLKKKDLEIKPISEDEIPFEIPKGWVWVRWGELGEYKKGPFGSSLTKSMFVPQSKSMFVPQSDEAVKVYEQKNAIQKDYSLGDYYVTKEKYETMTGFTVRPGDIIVSCAGTIGETYLLPPEAPIGIINQALMRAKLHLDSIIPYWLLHFQYVLLIENKLKGSGSAIKNIPPFEVLKAMPVPLPPLAEQHRIVAKIEELLPKVEEYGKAQDALNKLNAELPERLKKSILQEAIEGRLVPQDPNDEPASVLLAQIRKEKEQLVKEGKLKKKDLIETPITEDEIPFEIPESWEWCRLMDICIFLSRGKSPSYSDIPNEYPVFAQKCNLKEGGISLEQARFLNPETVSKWQEEYHLRTDDVLVNSTGTGTVCRTRLFHESYLDNYLFTVPDSHVSVVRTSKCICSAFIFRLFNSKFYQDYWEDRLAGSTNQKELYISVLQNTIIPLPPLTEQHRIVEKLEQLLGEIDKLKK